MSDKRKLNSILKKVQNKDNTKQKIEAKYFLFKMVKLHVEHLDLVNFEDFSIFQNIKELSIKNTKLKELDLQHFPKLRRLLIVNFPATDPTIELLNLDRLVNLESLIIVGQKLRQFPPSVIKLKKLKHLLLNHNEISSLPSEINRLDNLQQLVLNSNNISEIPTELFSLKNLDYLMLHNNEIPLIPKAIGNLTELYYLTLEGNNTTILPTEVYGLKLLKTLELSKFREVDLSKICSLQKLNFLVLNSCEINSVPDKISDLKWLTWLFLSNNNLENLPKSFYTLESIKYLYLEQNNLTTLDNELSRLKNLEELFISDNKLQELPPFIEKFKLLKKLDIANNLLETLDFDKLPSNLEYIRLNTNLLNKYSIEDFNYIVVEDYDDIKVIQKMS